ncbi:class I SAM-dependent methyltransferase [Halocatena halophila]|uniref:class I SAM-dependent methyltransferase n=1 Tax=Halocatena halophila TaxID=2814576 RepID=UPI002ED15F1C
MAARWTLNEKQHAGEEHFETEAVAQFDEKMPFDPASEIEILEEMGLSKEDTVVDLGTGTGVLPIAIADHCDRVVAVDISETMIKMVDKSIEKYGIQNIETVHDGFLSYNHQGDPVPFVFSKDALHHLPDFWKIEALKNIGETLTMGGIFRLRDFVFSFDPRDSHETIEQWLDEKKEFTDFSDEELYGHFREEYSTYGFLLESMIEQAGFEILESTYEQSFYAEYICQWNGHSN